MYIAIKDNNIIAAHDDYDILMEYVETQTSDVSALKVKKKKSKELEDNPDFSEIYLVRYGQYYIPYNQYRAMKDLSSQRDDDLKYCRDVLYRILEEGNLKSKKDISAINKAILVVESEIESLDDPSYEKMSKLTSEMDELRRPLS